MAVLPTLGLRNSPLPPRTPLPLLARQIGHEKWTHGSNRGKMTVKHT